MQRLDFLNSKGRKEILESLQKRYGLVGDVPGQLLMGGKENLYVLEDSEFIRSSLDKQLRIDRAGLKIGSVMQSGIRLNIEGSQLLGPHCKKNIIEIDDNHLEPFVKGEDFYLSEKELGQAKEGTGLYILKYKEDFLGSSIVKEGKVWNQISKIRKVKNFNN